MDKRRIYIDLEENRVFTVNNQYAGNSVGLKTSPTTGNSKGPSEDWLAEHMFIMVSIVPVDHSPTLPVLFPVPVVRLVLQ